MIRKHHALFFVLSIAFISALCLPTQAIAGTEHNVYGWAWSSTIGWISFNNCTNPSVTSTCTGVNYGVSIEPSKTSFLSNGTITVGQRKITGYAWSPSIGWIRFGDQDPWSRGGDPIPTYAVSGNIAGDAYLLGGKTAGWARACTVYASGCSGAVKSKDANGLELGGWDGWISLKGGNPAYGISTSTISSTNTITISALRGFAWGAINLGWIKFDPLTASQTSQNNGCPGVCLVDKNIATTLNVVKIGTGTGSVTGGGISCGTTCTQTSKTYNTGTSITSVSLTAVADSNSTFNGWIDASGTNTCTSNGGTVSSAGACNITIPALTSKTITVNAKFTSNAATTATLSVIKVGTGAEIGTVSGTGISCGADCSEVYKVTSPFSKVNLKEEPNGSTFNGWIDANGFDTCTGNGGRKIINYCYGIPISASKTVYASFSSGSTIPTKVSLSVTLKGSGKVVTSYRPGNIGSKVTNTCLSSTCTYSSIPSGTIVELTASPSTGYDFKGWSGGLSDTVNPSSFKISVDTNVTATFEEKTVAEGSCTITCVNQNNSDCSIGRIRDDFGNQVHYAGPIIVKVIGEAEASGGSWDLYLEPSPLASLLGNVSGNSYVSLSLVSGDTNGGVQTSRLSYENKALSTTDNSSLILYVKPYYYTQTSSYSYSPSFRSGEYGLTLRAQRGLITCQKNIRYYHDDPSYVITKQAQ